MSIGNSHGLGDHSFSLSSLMNEYSELLADELLLGDRCIEWLTGREFLGQIPWVKRTLSVLDTLTGDRKIGFAKGQE